MDTLFFGTRGQGIVFISSRAECDNWILIDNREEKRDNTTKMAEGTLASCARYIMIILNLIFWVCILKSFHIFKILTALSMEELNK